MLDSGGEATKGLAVGDITVLLERARQGEPAAWEQVMGLLYGDLLRIARRTAAGGTPTLNATALVHECYLRVARGQPGAIVDRNHFLALASRAMRQLLVNHARDRLADKRGGGAIHVTLQEDQASVAQEADEVLMLDAALARLAGEDAALAQVVECRLFGGLTETETADALGVPLRTVQRRWQLAREKLREHLQPG
ncbi:ECF-type sigma factor [Thermomonas sp.]|uniref:ECF-type sigma factor n=1 Tax=Thermomonas sp. TaxID=1971895 RepID=UPI0035AED859